MSEIVLLALGARWSHTAFGARCLLANLGDLRQRAALVEATINERAIDIVERVLGLEPRVLGLGVYIWNAELTTKIVNLLTCLRPDLLIVLGGPEVIDPADLPPVARQAHHIISGEGEVAFRELCGELLRGEAPPRMIAASPVDLGQIELPYGLYSDEDIASRKIYVEASRGCPFGCDFCLSGRDAAVRRFPRARLLAALEQLWRRGARHFKFVDRAIHLAVGREVLEFFLRRVDAGTFLHFEVVPDHLPDALIELLGRFPAGSVQLEVGVQSFDPEVGRRINRRHDLPRLQRNITALRERTGAHIHADLIVGLPGETLGGFGEGFDRLLALGPHEVQVGLLKRLRGTAAARYPRRTCLFNPDPPYEVLRTAEIDAATLLRLRRFARFLDLLFNSGNFTASIQLLFIGGSPFDRFLVLSDWLFAATGETHRFALNRLARLLAAFLISERGLSPEAVSRALDADYARMGKRPIPLSPDRSDPDSDPAAPKMPPRQARHR